MRVVATELDAPDTRRLLLAYFDELRSRLHEVRPKGDRQPEGPMPGFEPPSDEQLRTDAARGAVLVGYEGALAVATGSLRRLDDDTMEVKRMFVAPDARGRGHGRRLLAALEDHARSLGCRRILLDTAAPLEEASRLYVREGYVAVERYNDNPYAAHWFEKKLLTPAP